MGYTTIFHGTFKLDKKLEESLVREIEKLREHNPYKLTDKEKAKSGLPASYCRWCVAEDRMFIEWDGVEKFYKYLDWLEYIIKNILERNGYTLSGEVIAEGELIEEDLSTIKIVNNRISVEKFTKEEIELYKERKEQKRLSTVGNLIAKTKVAQIFTSHNFFQSLRSLIMEGLSKSDIESYLVLVKEKDGRVTFGDVIRDELDERRFEHAEAVANIEKIIHYNSPLFRKILRSDKVFSIKKKEWKIADAYYVEDPNFIKELVKYNRNIHIENSSDSLLFWFLVARLTLLFVILIATYYAILFVIATLLSKNIPLILVTFLLLIPISIFWKRIMEALLYASPGDLLE